MEVEKLQALNDQRKYIEDIEVLVLRVNEVLKTPDNETVRQVLMEVLAAEKVKFQLM